MSEIALLFLTTAAIIIFNLKLIKTLRRLRALERYFKVTPYAGAKSNVIVGIHCPNCETNFSIDENIESYTSICPKCFNVKSQFQLEK